MDMPYPDTLGKDPMYDEFMRSNHSFWGLVTWFDLMERSDLSPDEQTKAKELLPRIRGLWFTDTRVADSGTSLAFLPKLPPQVNVHGSNNRLAALFEADQRKEKPGNLDPAEVEYLIGKDFENEFSVGAITGTLYPLGRYYAKCGEREKAIDSYRRILAITASFENLSRCLAVRELRKLGMSNDDYVKYSQGDPKFPRFKISEKAADVFVRQHFRIYTESPSATLLARPVAAKPAVPANDEMATPWTPGLYRVTSANFRGEAVPANELVVHWKVPQANISEWNTYGIATVGTVPVQVSERRDGIYPLKMGKENPVSVLASFQGDRLVLVVSLNSDEEPKDIRPAPESDCVRIEMIRVAEI
jgi:hypothetical protein